MKKNIQRTLVRLFRAQVHHAIHKNADQTTRGDLNRLKGWASFLMSINHDKGSMYMNQLLEFEKVKFGKAA